MMIRKALGLLETYGYIGAIEAADACLKAANVELIGLEFVRGGLVTIKICGDVSAVKASIDAGATAAARVGKVISIDVIARMGEGLEKIVTRPKECGDVKERDQYRTISNDEDSKEHESCAINRISQCDVLEIEELETLEENLTLYFDSDVEEINKEQDIRVIKEAKKDMDIVDKKYIIDYKGKAINIRDEKALINMKVVDLRRIARRVNGISIEKSQIKFAKKKELIEALTNCFKREAE
ncbi:Carboxysome shell and ethanolamine utilization microcompartment protein CcmL/EutN [Paramaledivibacter caminithermalis DSM 15212]|uniref:Carboxysome shell and ethanolamine utilization microcompartment protein CcmL/EutN n=1 Tax=Paramaledivibacter caminithermalis (strain DSM 15212 / CIP 107654 / DViRD3) TaxID=1121301 RepID=A0A1M6PNQ9_PARC5|nr:BMC domain-containing protein [Paramaledivibacter caminithermalis]SHK09586.1 Carboxysome shell and ethanolamine utilization microcompartment protein CcmL/EutN [Paramaledivibacter caminithermalis DSM 15212]